MHDCGRGSSGGEARDVLAADALVRRYRFSAAIGGARERRRRCGGSTDRVDVTALAEESRTRDRERADTVSARDRAVSDETDRTFLSVMLIVSDAVAAVGWYKTVLGASELWDLGGVAGLHVQGAPFFVHEAVPGKTKEPSPTDVGLTTTRIELFVEEPRHFIDRAAEAGATDIAPPIDHETPWGTHRQGAFTDPFGHRWSVGDRTPLERSPRS